MSNNSNKDICYLCLRIPSPEVLKVAHQIWSKDSKVARKMGLKACRKIEEAYKQKPTHFCGRGKKFVLAGLFYYLSIISENKVTQKKLRHLFNISAPALRFNFEHWVKLFHKSVDDFRKSYMPSYYKSSLELRDLSRKCANCGACVTRRDTKCWRCGSWLLFYVDGKSVRGTV